MPQNIKARTSSGLCACIVVIMAILVSLNFSACASGDTQSPAAAEGRPLTLREALSPEDLSTVALLDGQTPFPSTAGKAALFVDGNFYAPAEAAVKGYVREQAEAGVPVAIFGDQTGYEALRAGVAVCADLSAETALQGEDAPNDGVSAGGDAPRNGSPNGNPTAAARGLKLYPNGSGAAAGSAAIEIAGSPDNLAPLIGPMIQWAQACAEDLP